MKNIKPLTIFMIDDNDLDLFICEKIIHTTYPECKITTFRSGYRALMFLKAIYKTRAIKHAVPDLILLDLHMSFFNGFDFIHEFSLINFSNRNKPEIIVLSCSLNPDDKKTCSDKMIRFIEKPITIDNLLSTSCR